MYYQDILKEIFVDKRPLTPDAVHQLEEIHRSGQYPYEFSSYLEYFIDTLENFRKFIETLNSQVDAFLSGNELPSRFPELAEVLRYNDPIDYFVDTFSHNAGNLDLDPRNMVEAFIRADYRAEELIRKLQEAKRKYEQPIIRYAMNDPDFFIGRQDVQRIYDRIWNAWKNLSIFHPETVEEYYDALQEGKRLLEEFGDPSIKELETYLSGDPLEKSASWWTRITRTWKPLFHWVSTSLEKNSVTTSGG